MPSGPKPKMYRYLGESLTLKDWAEVAGLPFHTLRQRILAGWKFSDAVLHDLGERPLARGGRGVTP